ncbi:unnamed protein product, partial [Iphiclides podalirius]
MAGHRSSAGAPIISLREVCARAGNRDRVPGWANIGFNAPSDASMINREGASARRHQREFEYAAMALEGFEGPRGGPSSGRVAGDVSMSPLAELDDTRGSSSNDTLESATRAIFENFTDTLAGLSGLGIS